MTIEMIQSIISNVINFVKEENYKRALEELIRLNEEFEKLKNKKIPQEKEEIISFLEYTKNKLSKNEFKAAELSFRYAKDMIEDKIKEEGN